MADDLKRTVRILAPKKVATDDRGQTVWTAPIETTELELVSTVMLKRVLASDDDERKRKIKAAAAGKDGILAHNAEDDSFSIVNDADLSAAQKALSQDASAGKSADVVYEPISDRVDNDDEELSLVSTMALRRILKVEEDPVEAGLVETDQEEIEKNKSFNPYDSG